MSDELIQVTVRHREVQGENVVVLELASTDGTALPAFEAGAHIDLHLPGGLVRQYSLCSDPADCSAYRIGVLKDPQSRGGSVAVFDTLKEGVTLEIGAPRNLFPLDTTAQRSILLGGGIGITPMIAMAWALFSQGKPFDLYYCGRSRATCAFVDSLEAAPFAESVHFHFADEHDGAFLDLDPVLSSADAGVHLYTCGPVGFMDWAFDAARARDFSENRIHREFFQVEVDASGDSFEVVAAASGKTVQVKAGQSIVEALAEVGIKVDVSCEQGVCGTCLCDVLEGVPDHRDVYLDDEEKAENDQILLCCSRAKSDRLVLDI